MCQNDMGQAAASRHAQRYSHTHSGMSGYSVTLVGFFPLIYLHVYLHRLSVDQNKSNHMMNTESDVFPLPRGQA